MCKWPCVYSRDCISDELSRQELSVSDDVHVHTSSDVKLRGRHFRCLNVHTVRGFPVKNYLILVNKQFSSELIKLRAIFSSYM